MHLHEEPGEERAARATAILAALRATLGACPLPRDTQDRILRYASRHLPVDGRPEGSPFIPPMYALRVGEALGLSDTILLPFTAAGCLYFSAADVADDCADGQVRTSTGIDVNDTCILLFACQFALLQLPVGSSVRLRLLELFAQKGIEMAVGQEADLRGSDRHHGEDPLTIARGKTGSEFAAFFAGPALLAGVNPTPWQQFGAAFGALVQVLTDYFDLFLDPQSDDWEAGKPTLAIRHGLAHPVHGPAIARLLAGDRAGHDRKLLGLWHLVQAGVGPRFTEVVEALSSEMKSAEAQLAQPSVLAAIRTELTEWCEGVADALDEYRRDEAPLHEAPEQELADCRQAARQFLQADEPLEEATEVHRHGLFGAAEVRGGLFGRAVALDALAGEPLPLLAAREATFALADSDGWRYYPGHFDLPTDSDCVGVMMQLAAGTVEAGHPAHARGEALLLHPANQDSDGLFYTWLADPHPTPQRPEGRFTRAGIDAIWAGEVCPGAAANALLGLWRRDPERLAGVVRPRARALAGRLAVPEAPPSAFYTPVGVDYMAGRALWTLRGELAGDAGWRHAIDAALDAIAARMSERERLSGRFGNVLDTALCAFMLARLGRLERFGSVRRALVDAQDADGGFPADPFYRTVPHPVTAWYGSRVVTTAFVLQALRALDGADEQRG